MNNLNEIIGDIELYHKSKIKSATIHCEVDTQIAKYYLYFNLKNGDYEEVCIYTLHYENLSSDDVRVVLAYIDLVKKYTDILTTDYNIECSSLGIYDKQILKRYSK